MPKNRTILVPIRASIAKQDTSMQCRINVGAIDAAALRPFRK